MSTINWLQVFAWCLQVIIGSFVLLGVFIASAHFFGSVGFGVVTWATVLFSLFCLWQDCKELYRTY